MNIFITTHEDENNSIKIAVSYNDTIDDIREKLEPIGLEAFNFEFNGEQLKPGKSLLAYGITRLSTLYLTRPSKGKHCFVAAYTFLIYLVI